MWHRRASRGIIFHGDEIRTLVPEASISGMESNCIPQNTVGCNYLSLPEIPASGTKVRIIQVFNSIIIDIGSLSPTTGTEVMLWNVQIGTYRWIRGDLDNLNLWHTIHAKCHVTGICGMQWSSKKVYMIIALFSFSRKVTMKLSSQWKVTDNLTHCGLVMEP